MNYSLSSSRKIGDYIQKIITTRNNAAKATDSSFLSSLQSWHTAFTRFDAPEREVGVIEFKGFTEAQSAGSSNTGTMADITFTVLNTSAQVAANPKTTTLKVNDVTIDNLGALDTAFTLLTGMTINDSNNYLISAIINLH